MQKAIGTTVAGCSALVFSVKLSRLVVMYDITSTDAAKMIPTIDAQRKEVGKFSVLLYHK